MLIIGVGFQSRGNSLLSEMQSFGENLTHFFVFSLLQIQNSSLFDQMSKYMFTARKKCQIKRHMSLFAALRTY